MVFGQNDLTEEWEYAIDEVVQELGNRTGVKRMAYHIWHWDLRKKQEAEEYVTYFHLKHA